MKQEDIISIIADIHNRLTEISVRGDDVMRMADILQRCRGFVHQMQNTKEYEAPQTSIQ